LRSPEIRISGVLDASGSGCVRSVTSTLMCGP
jgi:hypothetical protein